MAGVSDRPFRQICRASGAALASSEMIASAPRLRASKLSRRRLDLGGEAAPRVVQIVGADPRAMAETARLAVDAGAQIVDINMGCPAKRVCGQAAGSALMRDVVLVRAILEAVVSAVAVPVTLKMRTGWDPQARNAPALARLAENIGIQGIAVHGRTRACGYRNSVEYETLRRVKSQVTIPVFANGDIDSPEKARQVLDATGAEGIMLGRAAIGNPWLLSEVAWFLNTGKSKPAPTLGEISNIIIRHLDAAHSFYGDLLGARIMRKHLRAYLRRCPDAGELWRGLNSVESGSRQIIMIKNYFDDLLEKAVVA